MTRPSVHELVLSRRRVLVVAAGAMSGAALLSVAPGAVIAAPTPTPAPAAPTPTPAPAGPPADAVVTYRSRPDLRSPRLSVTATGDATADALFLTPRYGGAGEGVMVFDGTGDLVWQRHVPGRSAVALQPVTFAGKPALWWWEGVIRDGLGDGEFVIVDDQYREKARIRAVAKPADLHDLVLTPGGEALLFALDETVVDGQPIADYLIQQVDVATGRLVWEWRASDHIPLDEMVEKAPDDGPWDFVHLNSIDVDPDGDLLISARHTDTVYRVSRETGEIVWRLGGPRSDFLLPPEAVFHRQHFARFQSDGTLSLFDNATSDPENATSVPRGLVLRLDEAAGTAAVVMELRPPRPVNSSSQGNLQIAPDGSATVGWGSASLFTGYDADGSIVLDGAMPPGFTSYRAFRAPWVGRPVDLPIAVIEPDADGAPTLWVSWNGATDVAAWRVEASDAAAGTTILETPRTGFETAIPLPSAEGGLVVVAVDADGRELARADVSRGG